MSIVDMAKIQKIIAALSVSMEAMNASEAEATYAFAFLHKDAMTRFMLSSMSQNGLDGPSSVAIMQKINEEFMGLGENIDEFASSLAEPPKFSDDAFFVDPNVDLVH